MRRHNESQWLAAGFGFRIAEQGFGAWVPAHDVARTIGGDDGLAGRLGDSPVAGLALAQRLLGPLALADVQDAVHAAWSVRQLHLADDDLDRYRRPVRPEHLELELGWGRETELPAACAFPRRLAAGRAHILFDGAPNRLF